MSNGYKLVPAEPTEEMLQIGCDAYFDSESSTWTAMADAYKAMLVAAPQPPALCNHQGAITEQGNCMVCGAQPPALGGEPVEIGIEPDEVIEELLMMANMADDSDDQGDHLMYMRWIARIRTADAKVAPLQAEIERRDNKLETMRRKNNELNEDVAKLKARCDELEAALSGLVTINEQHNAAVAKIIETPLGWKDEYLDIARAALSKPAGSEQV